MTTQMKTQTTCPLKAFTQRTGITLSRNERGTDINAWKGINQSQIEELINFSQISGKTGGDFHAWNIHKKTKKLYDDYSDPTTPTGSILAEIMKIHNCDEIVYEEFTKLPKYLEQMRALENERHRDYEWYDNYTLAQDWSMSGYCFQRAHQKWRDNKNWKIKFGSVFIRNSKTGKKYNIEGEDADFEDGFIDRHITLIKNRVERGRLSKSKAKILITFFMGHSHELMNNVVDMWSVRKERRTTMIHQFGKTKLDRAKGRVIEYHFSGSY